MTLLNLSVFLGMNAQWASKATGAETIYINYGPLEFSLPIEALEIYLEEGIVSPDLASYANLLNEQQLEQLREALITSADLSPVAVSQFLYSPQGEVLLRQVGEVVQTTARQSGFYALRSALILAAADEQGLTALNVLKKFPTQGIRINTGRGFEIFEDVNEVIVETGEITAVVQQESFDEVLAASVLNFTDLPDLRQPGPISSRRQSFLITDARRNRRFPVDLYLPQLPETQQLPVVVISHGLGSDRSTFAYFARHLASYGYAVAVPEHPGSNTEQLEALLEGVANVVTPPRELIDRPLDITFLLNQLESLYGERLNLQQVGVIGQSFGGYTALALAGADLNFERLQTECQSLENALNLSLLLQCIALELPQAQYNLRDERIAAAIAINPLTSRVFGQEQLASIDIPVMIVSGSADAVTPALPEQIRPFTWLGTPDKYLVLMQGGTHFSTLDESESAGAVPIPAAAVGPAPELAQEYIQALGLAFFSTYTAGEPDYQIYLSASYAQSLSQEPLPLYLVRSLPESISRSNGEREPN
ncbi:MAG: alpha/beta hydrolase [Cyanophyceae cyanobacterium]